MIDSESEQAPQPAKSIVELQRLRGCVNDHAETVLAQKFADSQIPNHSHKLPRFSVDEVIRGKYLGKGFFGMVYEIQCLDGRNGEGKVIDGSNKNSKASSSYQNRSRWLTCGKQQVVDHDKSEDESSEEMFSENKGNTFEDLKRGADEDATEKATALNARQQEAKRSFIQNHCRRENGQTRYALKILRPQVLKDPTKLYFQGVMDLQSETRLLSSIQHPNIIKLRGIAANTQCHEDYFLILDRLYEVLEDRLKVWQRKHKLYSGPAGKLLLDRHGRQQAQLWKDRLIAAHDLASALGYLHSRRIIHRDLKSDNIGFDIRGDLKIFDFGLARELPPISQATDRGTWNMTGSTGTPRYMSPEVALDKDYNESCDSYSFCMLIWELLALKTPFELYSMKSFIERVWNSPHKRPPLDPTWPRPIHRLLQQGWHPDLTQRPPMIELTEILRLEVIQSRQDVDQRWGLDVLAERRSTHVFIEDNDVDKSHKSILSTIFSSPFHAKSPLRFGGGNSKSSPSSKSTPPYQNHRSYKHPPNSPCKDINPNTLDLTKATAVIDNSFSPTLLDHSGSNASALSPPQFVHSLPIKPPLFDDDYDDDYEDDGDDSNPNAKEPVKSVQHSLSLDAIAANDNLVHSSFAGGGSAAAIWGRLEEEKARRERIRQHISVMKKEAGGRDSPIRNPGEDDMTH